MKKRELIERLKREEARTSYGAGVRSYAIEMVEGIEGEEVPGTYGGLAKSVRWALKGERGEEVARRLGLENVVDVEKSDMGRIREKAQKSAFMLIWAEVESLRRMGETFMIRRVEEPT